MYVSTCIKSLKIGLVFSFANINHLYLHKQQVHLLRGGHIASPYTWNVALLRVSSFYPDITADTGKISDQAWHQKTGIKFNNFCDMLSYHLILLYLTHRAFKTALALHFISLIYFFLYLFIQLSWSQKQFSRWASVGVSEVEHWNVLYQAVMAFHTCLHKHLVMSSTADTNP